MLGKPSPLALALAESPLADRRCPFGQFIADSPDREAIEAALAAILEQRRTSARKTTGYTAPWLSGVLAAHGHKFSRLMINHHLAGGCVCVAD